MRAHVVDHEDWRGGAGGGGICRSDVSRRVYVVVVGSGGHHHRSVAMGKNVPRNPLQSTNFLVTGKTTSLRERRGTLDQRYVNRSAARKERCGEQSSVGLWAVSSGL